MLCKKGFFTVCPNELCNRIKFFHRDKIKIECNHPVPYRKHTEGLTKNGDPYTYDGCKACHYRRFAYPAPKDLAVEKMKKEFKSGML